MNEEQKKLLSERCITKSTMHMDSHERLHGIRQMLSDLEQLARWDGCIAAAWALEVIETFLCYEKDE